TVNGSVQGGSGEQGHGVWIDGGYQGSSYENSLVVNSGGWVSSLSGNAVTFTTNGGTVENHGSVVGSVENGFIFNYGTYYTNGTDISVLPDLFVNEGGRIGLSPSYRGGPTELTTAITGDVPVVYQVDTGTVFSILTDNSYTGGTTLAGGVVATNSNGAFSTGDIVVINPTAEIRTTSDTDLTIANNVSLAQTLTLSTADADSSLTMSGIISGAGGISTAGPGMVVLSGNNAYTGPTSVGGGTLVAGTATAVSSGPLAIAAGATFDVNGFAYSFETLSGAGTLTSSSGSPSLTLGAAGVVYKFDGVIDSGIGAVTFNSGTAILTGANAYTGGTTLTGGPTAIVLGNDQALSSGPITVNASYAYFYTVGDNPITLANDIQLVQPLSVSTDADGPSLTLTGTISGDVALYK
ncbi:MAG: autotransporter-associated beta strand repeat-containing protein, partial [Mycobacterium sp.]